MKWMKQENLRTISAFRRKGTNFPNIRPQNQLQFPARDLIPNRCALHPGGVFVFDSILDSPYVQTTHKKAFLLQPGELQSIFSAFPGKIFLPEERLHDRNPTARLIFQKA
jgi:hypothetical protein